MSATAAAAGSTVQDLCKEATCSICLDYFRDPVIITECGHNFCRACLSQYSGESDVQASCPQCRGTFQKRNLRPNRQLATVVQIAKTLREQGVKGAEGKEQVCSKHQEPLKLFCKDHEALICVVCDRAKEHRDHQVVPLEEVSQKYKDLLHHRLEILMKEKQGILGYKAEAERETQELLKQIKTEREKTVDQFRNLHQFLEELEKLLLTQVDELAEEVAKKRDEQLAKLYRDLSSLEIIIWEMKEKIQQPPSKLLQDVRSTLQRSEKEPFDNPVTFHPELKWRIWDFCDINPFLEGVMRQFKATITLDPDTANPDLVLSEDCKSVRWEESWQYLPDNPERFNCHPIVLGCQEFTAGRHFWDVCVESGGDWAVGVARKSVRRKGTSRLYPEEGVWAVRNFEGAYQDLNPPGFPHLPASRELKSIRVSLNCKGGRVAFYNTDQGTLLYAFTGASFSGETLLPLFYVAGKDGLTLSS
ncbi:Zinc finger protein RFP [Varanus komodoensis]|nr:Zinc finger protein RFP [Varanus komodoensis]